MSVIRRWLGIESAPKTRSALASLLFTGGHGARSSSGVAISEESSLRNSAVLAGVRIFSNSVAMLPLPVYRRLSPRGKECVAEHPLYPLLHEQANPEMTTFELRRWFMQNVLLYGNGFAEIEWSDVGALVNHFTKRTAILDTPPAYRDRPA